MLKNCMLSVVACALLCYSCGHEEIKSAELAGVVKTEVACPYQNELAVVYPGKVKAASDVNLSFRVAGPLAALPAEVGAFVKKASVLRKLTAGIMKSSCRRRRPSISRSRQRPKE